MDTKIRITTNWHDGSLQLTKGDMTNEPFWILETYAPEELRAVRMGKLAPPIQRMRDRASEIESLLLALGHQVDVYHPT